jgi:hypothetical protein
MTETQMDRIENMLKVLIGTNTSIELPGNPGDKKALRSRVETYTSNASGSP